MSAQASWLRAGALWLRIVAASMTLLVCGCSAGDDGVHATTLEPSYGDPCRYAKCSGRGICVDDGARGPSCVCDDGYGAAQCDACAEGFHYDAVDRCVPDRSCADAELDPCGLHGRCDDRIGVIECRCDLGYEGPRCMLCASGFDRDRDDQCLQVVLGGGGGGGSVAPDDGSAGTGADPDEPADGGVAGAGPPESCTDDTCHGRGECDEIGDDVRCLCEVGYQGGQCESCAEGFGRHEGACEPLLTCDELTCAHGTCADDFGLALCTCDGGWSGRTCDACAVGFHEGSGGSCLIDEACTPTSCSANATCSESGGSPSCACKTGYAGALCDACAASYYRHYASGTCKPFDCHANPIDAAATIDFETWLHFPSPANNCASNAALVTDDLTMLSIQGDGVAWTCSPSTLYDFETRHVILDAGVLGPAQLAFSGQIGHLAFDYAAYSAVAVVFFADGAQVGELSAARRTSGALAFDFSAPISLFEIRSTTTTSQLALDNLAYAPPACP